MWRSRTVKRKRKRLQLRFARGEARADHGEQTSRRNAHVTVVACSDLDPDCLQVWKALERRFQNDAELFVPAIG